MKMKNFRPGSWPLAVGICLVVIPSTARSALAQVAVPEPPPFVATPELLVREMLRLGEVTPGDTIYDLGSGDGRLVIAAAGEGAEAVGIEYDADLVALSRERARAAGVDDHTRFLHADIFESDVSDADVVMLYLSPEFNERLRPRLLEQLQPGARVVSHAFHMGDWAPDTTVTIGSGAGRATLFAWTIPARFDGFWSLQIDGMTPVALEFLQKYQRVTGALFRDGQQLELRSGTVRGELVTFEVAELMRTGAGDSMERLIFEGYLANGAISGSVQGSAGWGTRSWRAFRFNDPARVRADP